VLIDITIIISIVTVLGGVIAALFALLMKTQAGRLDDKDKCTAGRDAVAEKTIISLEKMIEVNRAILEAIRK